MDRLCVMLPEATHLMARQGRFDHSATLSLSKGVFPKRTSQQLQIGPIGLC